MNQGRPSVRERRRIVALGAKSAAALDRIYDVATRLSGITDEDVEEMAEEMVEHPFDETSTP